MQFKLSFSIDNAAFGDDGEDEDYQTQKRMEIARILHQVADVIDGQGMYRKTASGSGYVGAICAGAGGSWKHTTIRDVNGNTIGTFNIEHEHE